MPNDNSQAWIVAKSLILFAFVALFSYTNASNFDSTEITMLAQIGAVLFGGMFLEALIKKNS